MWNLIADVGGTNMRLAAMSDDGGISDHQSFHSKAGLRFSDACAAYIADRGAIPKALVVAAAGPVSNGAVRLTNAEQTISETDLAHSTGVATVKVLNDFEAAAWSLATVTTADVVALQGSADIPDGPRVIIGPGTGLGVGALVWPDGRPHVVRGEGGHVALSPHSARELPYFEGLTRLWPEVQIGPGCAVEAEGLISGTGLPLLYQAVAQADGTYAPPLDAEGIFAAAQSGANPAATHTVQLFQRCLAQLAGDLGLIFEATGGVFITGGVALSNPWLFDQTFLDAFNAGGRHTTWRRRLPVYLYRNHDGGLVGARNYIAAHQG